MFKCFDIFLITNNIYWWFSKLKHLHLWLEEGKKINSFLCGFNVMHSLFQQERHDVSSNGNPRLPHIPAVSQHLYSPPPSLSHTASSDFQPPYFPPPYQPLPYTQPSDPYSHLGDPFNINSIHQSAASNQQQSWPGRQGQEALGSHGRGGLGSPILGLEGGSSGMRRDGFRRPELLPPHVHGMDSIGDNIGLHDIGHGLDDVQVSWYD